MHLDLPTTKRRHHPVADEAGLAAAKLEQHGDRAVGDVVRELVDEGADDVHAGVTTVDGETGLGGADLGGEALELVGGDVGEVRGDHVERLADGFKEVAGEQHHAVEQAEARAVAARPRQRGGRRVGGEDLRLRGVARDGERNGAAARAGVGDAHEAARIGVRADRRQRRLHQRLRLRARDERAGADLERQAIELATPEDVRERLVLAAALQQRLERREMLGGGRLARRGDDLHARQPGCLAVQ